MLLVSAAFAVPSDDIVDDSGLLNSNLEALSGGDEVNCAWNPGSTCIRDDEWGYEEWKDYVDVNKVETGEGNGGND